jgi:hypothetical protein
METTDYNGWTNYATWRIQLEIIDDYVQATVYDDDNSDISDEWLNMSLYDLGQYFKDYVEEVIGFEQQDGLAWNYALAFIDGVDWREIAEHAQQVAKESKQLMEV